MGLQSYFKRPSGSSGASAHTPEAVVVARTRARRRLIGATVLLAVGVLGFPLLFETQPRPIPVDIPIEIPRKDNAPALVLPPKRPPTAIVAPAVAELPDAPASAAAGGSEAAVTAKPVASQPAPAAAAKRADDGQRARALLEGKAAPAPLPAASEALGQRMVVQVGAYTEPDKLREVRQRVEQLGMKTYTQVVESEAGRRTRVRVGPFATRQEAEQVAARLKAAGLPTAILAL
jgi:DedD protein